MQAFQNMSPLETVQFMLIVYAPYYLPVVMGIWLLVVGVLTLAGRRRAAKRALIALAIVTAAFILLAGVLGFAI